MALFLKKIKKFLIFLGKPLFLVFLSFLESVKWFFLITTVVQKNTSSKIKKVSNYFFLFLRRYLISCLKPKGKKKRKQKLRVKKSFSLLIKRALPLKELTIEKRQKIAIFLIILGIIMIIASFLLNLFHNLPSPNQLSEKEPFLTTKIYDQNKNLLYKIYRSQNRTFVPLEKIPNFLINATIAAEDKEFFHHNGISLKGIVRALFHNLLKSDKNLIGGSTITQQLVKNTLLSNEKTWKRKVKEAILALLVETKFGKEEILQMYFNEVPFGGTTYGAEEAAQKYFGKHVWEINEAEAAFLAGIPKAPSKYSPFGIYPDLAKKRQEQVIQEMVKGGYLNSLEAEKIVTTPLHFVPKKEQIKAPHFVFYIKDILTEKFGEQLVEQGGLEVITTLDWNIQKLAEEIVSDEVKKLSPLKVSNGASLVINPKNGAILAMVGSKDYFDFENDGNVNVVLSPRQPGSAIKPINYINALYSGFTAATIIPDTAITYKIPGQPPYSPRNYDNRFHGNIPVRIALASSLNVPAVKVLSSYGVEKMIETGKNLGITTWNDSSRFGLSLTLGGGEVKMIDLAQVYATLANLGEEVKINPIALVKDHKGKVLYKNPCFLGDECPKRQLIDKGIAFIINDILSDNKARSLAFGTNSLLNIPNQTVAVKTGTTNNLRDNWCFGYNPSFLVAAWVGNNDNTPMSYVASGITGATPIWNKIITSLLKNRPKENWPIPENVVKKNICQTTGTLPCESCQKIIEEYFLKGTEPQKKCQTAPPQVNPS